MRRLPIEDVVTLSKLKENVEAEAIIGAQNLKKAKQFDNKEEIGYWTAYVRDRESLLISLAEIKD